MTDIENVKDAGWELDRAGDDAAKLAVWAAKWGRALIVHARGW